MVNDIGLKTENDQKELVDQYQVKKTDVFYDAQSHESEEEEVNMRVGGKGIPLDSVKGGVKRD